MNQLRTGANNTWGAWFRLNKPLTVKDCTEYCIKSFIVYKADQVEAACYCRIVFGQDLDSPIALEEAIAKDAYILLGIASDSLQSELEMRVQMPLISTKNDIWLQFKNVTANNTKKITIFFDVEFMGNGGLLSNV